MATRVANRKTIKRMAKALRLILDNELDKHSSDWPLHSDGEDFTYKDICTTALRGELW